MESDLKSKIDLLERMAHDRGIGIEDASTLPSDDGVARIGLLSERLNLPLSAALDPTLGEADYVALMENEVSNG